MVAALLALSGCLVAPPEAPEAPDAPDAGSGPVVEDPEVQQDVGGPGGQVSWTAKLGASGDQRVRDIDRGMRGINTPMFAATSQGGSLRWGTNPEWAAPAGWNPTSTSLAIARNYYWICGQSPAESTGVMDPRALAIDSWQNLYTVGTTTAPVRGVQAGAFVFKSNFDGCFVWAQPLGSPSTQVSPRAADALPAQSQQPLFIGGSLHGAVSFGAQQLEAGLRPDAFVGRFDGSGGAVWLWHVGGEEGSAEVTALAAASDSVVLGGWFSGRVTVPGQPQADAGPTRRPFVVKLGLDGALRWWKVLPGIEGTVTSLRVTGAGTVVFAGDFRGVLQWGTGAPLTVNDEAVLATASAEGAEGWARRLTGASQPHFTLAKGDDVVLAAICGPTSDLGRGLIRSSVRAICAGRYALADAAVRWTRAFPASGAVDPPRITVHDHEPPFGEALYLVVSATGRAAFPTGALQEPMTLDGYDTVVVSLAP